MGKIFAGILAAAAAVIGAGAGITAYFYRRTMKRSRARTERTMKMSGTDWGQYLPLLKERRAWMEAQPHEDVWICSEDGLKLHGTYFPGEEGKKAVICFHGYTSRGMDDYVGLSGYYLKHGFRMLLVDERAHGDSQGEYIGFGCLDRFDGLKWISWMKDQIGEGAEILLHGTSMGGATVLMMTGLDLPGEVKGVVADCAFTSPREVFTHVLHSMYHLPAFPLIPLSDWINRRKAGYGLDDCNAAREVRRAKIPALLIHGDRDTFVPCSMCEKIYENYAGPKTKLIVRGAGHAESYYKDTAAYEKALDTFTEGIIS